MSLIGDRGKLDIGRGVSISSDISSSIASEWAAISSADAIISGIHALLRLNSGDSAYGDKVVEDMLWLKLILETVHKKMEISLH